MRLASYASVSLLVCAALGCAVACGDDDDSTSGTAGTSAMGGESTGTGGKASTGGSTSTAGKTSTPVGGEGGGGAVADSQLCTDLGGPAAIDAVVRGDGKTKAGDAFNGFKFGTDRNASVLLNVATDPCIGQQFASLLTPARAADLEHLAEVA